MNVVPAALTTSGLAARVSTDVPRRAVVAHIDIFARIEDAVPVWERMLDVDSIATPFADPAWIDAWHRHVGATRGAEPLIVVARDEFDAPLALLPFVKRRGRFCTVATFFGGTHSNLNLGVWRRDMAAATTAQQLAALLADVAARNGIDLFLLRNQPSSWEGQDNPFLLLPHQPASDDVYRLEFNGLNGEQVLKTRLKPDMRGRLKNKERNLAKLPGYRYFCAATEAEADRVLDAFFSQKAAQFAARGIRDVFSEPGIDAFLRDACKTGLSAGRPTIELHALEGGREILAVMGGIAGARRFAAMFNSYTSSEHSRWSPGLIIITHLIRACADRGLSSFDLGVGYADYKRFFCRDVDRLSDSFLPFSAAGRVAAMAASTAFAGKRFIKTKPALWNVLQNLRRVLP